MKIKVDYHEDNGIKINFCSAKMASTVDKLRELEGKTFRRLIRVARMQRRALATINKHYEDANATMKISVANKEAMVVNDLVLLGKDEFRRTIDVARQIRRADKIMAIANDAYTELRSDDKALRKAVV